jgi:dihydrofolate reductase
MGRIVVFNNVTLDGVMQAPGRPDEDTRGGFKEGGWAAPYGAMQSPQAMESVPGFGALLLGRFTYELLHDSWAGKIDNPFSEMLNKMQKYVVSTTLKEPLVWENSTLLKGDLKEAVTGVKAKEKGDVVVMGSGALAQSLIKDNLIDCYVLMVHPLVLGSGRKLFPDRGEETTLRLVSAKPTENGVVWSPPTNLRKHKAQLCTGWRVSGDELH